MNLFSIHTTLLLFICFSFTIITRGQSSNYFENILTQRNLGKTITKRIGNDISQRTYLGTIRTKSGEIKYFVLKEFYRVKAAVVYHGHSRLIFCSPNKKIFAQYILDLPDQLPYKLQQNILYFAHKENGILQRSQFELYDSLPKFMCFAPKNYCYEIGKE